MTNIDRAPQMLPPFVEFPKIPRWKREVVVTEKIDGTNAVIVITADGSFYTGSRNRWITPDTDNFGFSTWAHAHREELITMGEGYHYGEWWGAGIQRRYGLSEKRFSLFNVARWGSHNPGTPSCCSVVPILYRGDDLLKVESAIERLAAEGSAAAPGFANPEGVVIYHTALRGYFKRTIEKDAERKNA